MDGGEWGSCFTLDWEVAGYSVDARVEEPFARVVWDAWMAANAGFWNAGSGNREVEGTGGVSLSSF